MARSICTVDACTDYVVGRGWCRKHYLRWYKTGDHLVVRVARRGGSRLHEPGEIPHVTPLDTPCREWCGYRTTGGYGVVQRHGRKMRVHRRVWEMVYGPIPAGLVVLHLCDNPACFRLDHLRLGTKKDNTRDMVAKGRSRNSHTGKLAS